MTKNELKTLADMLSDLLQLLEDHDTPSDIKEKTVELVTIVKGHAK